MGVCFVVAGVTLALGLWLYMLSGERLVARVKALLGDDSQWRGPSAEATLKTKAAIATIQFPASEGPTLYESNEFGNDSSDCITGLKSTPLVKA